MRLAYSEEGSVLVLKRKVNERILIGPDIAIILVSVGEGAAQIGIDAPRTVKILREELAEPVATGALPARLLSGPLCPPRDRGGLREPT
jgi:carbon storage regulator